MRAFIKLVLLIGMLHLGVLVNLHPSLGATVYPLPQSRGVALNRIKAGFSINTVALVDNAASLGINTAFIYGTPFSPSDPVGAEMKAKGMHEVDAGVVSDLFYYECHRTHTVAPPPSGTSNTYCATDVNPSMSSETALLAAIDAKLQADDANPLITGYWVLDDWASWDAGSGRTVLQDIHMHIMQHIPHKPAICGFGVTIEQPGVTGLDSHLALNYSNVGCDMVAVYSYASSSSTYSNGSQLDFTMNTPLAALFNALKGMGWNSSVTPLIGIGQAFAGSYAGTLYEPGLTRSQMLAQATAFCKAGAISIGWYAWNDSGFVGQALTPMTSTEIQAGITSGIAACQGKWGVRDPR